MTRDETREAFAAGKAAAGVTEFPGHLHTIELMLLDGAEWPAIAAAIGWNAETARDWWSIEVLPLLAAERVRSQAAEQAKAQAIAIWRAIAAGAERQYDRLALCPDCRDKANGRCIACVAEERGRTFGLESARQGDYARTWAVTQAEIARLRDEIEAYKTSMTELVDANRQIQTDLQLTRGAMQADDERLAQATVRIGLEGFNCDAPDRMADIILALRDTVSRQAASLESQGEKLDAMPDEVEGAFDSGIKAAVAYIRKHYNDDMMVEEYCGAVETQHWGPIDRSGLT